MSDTVHEISCEVCGRQMKLVRTSKGDRHPICLNEFCGEETQDEEGHPSEIAAFEASGFIDDYDDDDVMLYD